MHNVSCVRVFGSAARGDNDSSSDIDVLVIYERAPIAIERERTLVQIKTTVGKNVDIAEYSAERIRHFFLSGDLFAWHLFQESMKLFSDKSDFIDQLGRPRPYVNAQCDISAFKNLLETVPENIKKHPENAVFEAGLLYLSTRNIAMSLSWHLESKVDFSRHAAVNVSERNGLPFPTNRAKYNELIGCRHASQRGEAVPTVSSLELSLVASKLVTWSNKISSLATIQTREVLNANTV